MSQTGAAVMKSVVAGSDTEDTRDSSSLLPDGHATVDDDDQEAQASAPYRYAERTRLCIIRSATKAAIGNLTFAVDVSRLSTVYNAVEWACRPLIRRLVEGAVSDALEYNIAALLGPLNGYIDAMAKDIAAAEDNGDASPRAMGVEDSGWRMLSSLTGTTESDMPLALHDEEAFGMACGVSNAW